MQTTTDEKQPLLAPTLQQPLPLSPSPYVHEAPIRSFRGPWWHVFGACEGHDCVAFCLAFKTPCIAWSWNQSRALGLSFLRELTRFILITAAISVGIQGLCCLMVALICGPPPHPENDQGMDDTAALSASNSGNRRFLLHWQDHEHEREEGEDHHPRHPPHLTEECAARVGPGMTIVFALGLALVISFLLFLARRRTALRAKFNIQGTACEDKALYLLCTPCALAQETRTLMHENVHQGVWYGAHPMIPAPQPVIGVPMPQKMVV